MMTMMIRHIVFGNKTTEERRKLMGEIDKLLAELDEQQQELNDKK